MRALLTLCLASMAPLAVADEVPLALPVTEAQMFPMGAEVVARQAVELPAGDHVLYALVPPELAGQFQHRIDGATLLSARLGGNTARDAQEFETPLQRDARVLLAVAEVERHVAHRSLEEAKATRDALEASKAFLTSIRNPNGLSTGWDLSAVTEQIKERYGALALEVVEAEQDIRAREAELESAEEALSLAQLNFDALQPPEDDWLLATYEIRLAEAGSVALEHVFFDDFARWAVSYDALLSDTGILRLERAAAISHGGALAWQDVSVTLSTARPLEQLSQTEIGRSIARIGPPAPQSRTLGEGAIALEAPMMEADVALAPALFATPDLEGPVLRYALPEPVSIRPGDETRVALTPLEVEADVFLAASPRFDETAFVMAAFTNAGEPILPGSARFFRDAALVGAGAMPFVPAGVDAELGFGPEDSIRLETRFLDQQEGDRGFIRGRNTRRDDIRVTLRNLGGEDHEVRLRYATPASQQEDLTIDVDLRPAPDMRDVEDRIGVMEWRAEVAAGSAYEIALRFDFSWPEDQVLRWRP